MPQPQWIFTQPPIPLPRLRDLFERNSGVYAVMSNSFWTSGLSSTRLLCPWDSPGKNIGVDCHAPLQGIFLIQGSNLNLLCLPNWQAGSLPLGPPGKSEGLVSQLCLTLCDPMDSAVMEFSRQEDWSALPCPPPGDLPDLGIEPKAPVSPVLQADSLPTEPPGKPLVSYTSYNTAACVIRWWSWMS